jgi:hypothetical protein
VVVFKGHLDKREHLLRLHGKNLAASRPKPTPEKMARAAKNGCAVIASGAKQSCKTTIVLGDCFVAALLYALWVLQ